MHGLSREQVLAKRERRREFVPIPELEGEFGPGAGVWVQVMSSLERDRFEKDVLSDKGNVEVEGVRARVVALTAVDEDGRPLFTEADVRALEDMDSAIVDRPFQVASRINRLNREAVEELLGKSDPTRNGSSSSSSPAPSAGPAPTPFFST